LNSASDLSKSRFFFLQDGTIVSTGQPAADTGQSVRLPVGIIDQKYQILGLLGEGGMGAVYKAHHLMLDKDVALKTFRSANLTEEERLRFQREAQAIAKLSHKNVIQVFDFGLSEDGLPYYTMEYLQGQSLADRIKKHGPLTAGQAIDLFVPVCQGLSLAHSKGIIHRDLKPANLFIETTPTTKGTLETVRIVDFGIASLANQSLEGQRLTTLGTIFGSPLYMSPEQSRGEPITERADIYSLGCTLFEALCGTPPFRGVNALDTISMHHRVRPPTLKEASGGQDFPSALERTVATMLAKSPEERPTNMAQVAADLARLKPGPAASDKRSLGNAGQAAQQPDFAQQENKEASKTPRRLTPRLQLAVAAGLILTGVVVTAYLYMGAKAGHVGRPADLVGANASNGASQLNRPAASKKASSKTPAPTYKREEGPDGRMYEVFTFRPDLELGTFRYSLSEGHSTPDRGSVRWLSGRSPIFEPSSDFLEDMGNLDVFQPDHLGGLDLRLGRPDQKDSKLLRHIGRLAGLKFLELEDSEIGNGDLEEIKKLPLLKRLNVTRTGISGAALATLPQLRELNSISMRSCEGARDLLLALKGSAKINALDLSEDPLTTADFKIIGTLSNLEILQVKDCGMNDAGFVTIASLPKLTFLEAGDYAVTPETIKLLKTMKKHGLKNLFLNGVGLPERDKQAIKDLIPEADFRYEGNKNAGHGMSAELTRYADSVSIEDPTGR
jgi:serine/threonine protein kinase